MRGEPLRRLRHGTRRQGLPRRPGRRDVALQASVASIEKEKDRITAVTTRDGRCFGADAVVDATGTSAAPANCNSHGRGCAMCILRCHSFLPRTSVTALAGIEEWNGAKADGSLGAMSGSCKLFKVSLDPSIVAELNETGVCLVPLPTSCARISPFWGPRPASSTPERSSSRTSSSSIRGRPNS